MSVRRLDVRGVRKQGALVALQFYLASKLYGLYGLKHRNTVGAIGALLSNFRTFLQVADRLTIRVESRHVFVNTVRIRRDQSMRAALEWFVQRFSEGGFLSVAMAPGLTVDEITTALPLFADAHWEEGADSPPIEAQLHELGIKKVRVRMRRFRDESEEREHRVQVSMRGMAAVMYGRLHQTVREFHEQIRRGEPLVLKRAKLLVHQAADLIAEKPGGMLALLRARAATNEESYLCRHMTNVCILSLALGVRLGLSREQLLGLGCAALVYDVGMALVPMPVRESTKPLTQDQREFVRRHPGWAARAIMSGGDRTPQAFAAMVVAARHHDHLGYPGLVKRPCNLLTDIVTTADAYEALTSRRPWRPALSPADAFGSLLATHDPSLVKLLANVVGVFPIGILVELDTGEIGVVQDHADDGGEPRDLMRPRVKLLMDAGGHSLDGDLIETDERSPDGSYRRTVRKVLDANVLDIGVADLASLMD